MYNRFVRIRLLRSTRQFLRFFIIEFAIVFEFRKMLYDRFRKTFVKSLIVMYTILHVFRKHTNIRYNCKTSSGPRFQTADTTRFYKMGRIGKKGGLTTFLGQIPLPHRLIDKHIGEFRKILFNPQYKILIGRTVCCARRIYRKFRFREVRVYHRPNMLEMLHATVR